jgi:hypothetical protein
MCAHAIISQLLILSIYTMPSPDNTNDTPCKCKGDWVCKQHRKMNKFEYNYNSLLIGLERLRQAGRFDNLPHSMNTEGEILNVSST